MARGSDIFFFFKVYSNMTSFFRFVNKRASYSFGIISLAHAPVNVTDFSIGSINCNPNNADKNVSMDTDTLLTEKPFTQFTPKSS
jgi:hypothetical protein